MNEKSYQFFDSAIKIISVVAVVAGHGWGAVQYFDAKRQGYCMQVWNKKLEYYLQASTAVAKISTAESASKVKEDIGKFWSLYYGPMALLEDSNVKKSIR